VTPAERQAAAELDAMHAEAQALIASLFQVDGDTPPIGQGERTLPAAAEQAAEQGAAPPPGRDRERVRGLGLAAVFLQHPLQSRGQGLIHGDRAAADPPRPPRVNRVRLVQAERVDVLDDREIHQAPDGSGSSPVPR
jgi:hypothetical protein